MYIYIISTSLKEKNADGTKNFDVLPLLNLKSRKKLETRISSLFVNDDDIALFYFSGHGSRKGEVWGFHGSGDVLFE